MFTKYFNAENCSSDFSALNNSNDVGFIVHSKTLLQRPNLINLDILSSKPIKSPVNMFQMNDIAGKTIAIRGERPEMLELALFLANFAQCTCIVLANANLMAKIDDLMLPKIQESYQKFNVWFLAETVEMDESVMEDLKKVEFVIEYPNFICDFSLVQQVNSFTQKHRYQ